MVSIISDAQDPLTRLEAVPRLAMLYQRARCLMVLLDREKGSDWGDVGAKLGLDAAVAQQLYGEVERRWRAGDPAPWTPDGADAELPIVVNRGNVEELAYRLDAHMRNRRVGTAEHPVSDGLSIVSA